MLDRAQGPERGNPRGQGQLQGSQLPAEPLPAGPHPFLLAPGHTLPPAKTDLETLGWGQSQHALDTRPDL